MTTRTLGAAVFDKARALGAGVFDKARTLGAVTYVPATPVSTFNMADYGTPVGDYDLRGDGLSDGASVSVFTENLGTGPVMTAPAASAQASYVAASTSLLFDGSDYYRAPDKASFNFLHQDPCTVFMRVKTPPVISGNQSLLNTDQSITGGIGWFLSSGRPRFYNHSGSALLYSSLAPTTLLADTWYTLGFIQRANTAHIFVGASQVSGVGRLAGWGSGDSRFVAEIGGYNGSQGWTGEIKRILIWSTDIAALDVPAVVTELES